MRFNPRYPILALKVMPLCLFIGLLRPVCAPAYSRISDLKLLTEGGRIRLVFLLDAWPDFKLACRGWKGLEISFPNIEGSERLSNRLKSYGSSLVMNKKIDSSTGIAFHLQSPGSIRQIDGSWSPEKRLFLVDIYPSLPESDMGKIIPPDNRLKDIRFGTQETSTRMVMGFDRRPDWELDKKAGTGIRMTIEAKAAGERRFGPMKRLDGVYVRQQEKGLELSLKPVEQPRQIRIFWAEEGNRLVMDLVDQSAAIDEGRLDLHEDDRKEITGTMAKEEAGPMEDQGKPVNGETAESEMNTTSAEGTGSLSQEINGRTNLPQGESVGHTNESLSGPSVRRKISVPPLIAPSHGEKDESNVPPPLKTALTLSPDPRLDNPIGDPGVDIGFQGKLTPQEAFLYGRIEEAGEIHDFERGISLINRFLGEFSDSSIKEKLFFWRGDFYYRLWQQGKSDASETAIKYLQEAVERYGDSPYVAPGLIKISQMKASLGNNLEAVGLLSVLIRKQEPGYLPLAYLSRGKTYFKINQAEKGIKDLKILLREYPDSPYSGEARFWIANYLQNEGIYDQAKVRLDEIERINPEIYYDYPRYLFLRAQNYVYLKQYDQAREYYYKGLNLGGQPESVDMLLSRIGDTYHQQSREKEAERIYRMVVDYYPQSEGASIAKLRLADYTSDMELLEEISRENPGEPITDLALLEKANGHYEKGQLTEVMDTLKEMLLKPVLTQTRQEARQLFNRAAEKEIDRLFRTGQYEGLIDLYHRERSLLSDGLNPATMYLVAQTYHHLGEYQNALSTFLEIKDYDLEPGLRGNYFMTLADTYLKEGFDGKALEVLVKHQQDRLEAKDSQELTLMLAGIYRDRGDLSKAFAQYQSVIKSERVLSDGEIAEAYLYGGKISNQEGKPAQALEYLNHCVSLIEKDGSQSKNLSLAYIERGNSYYERGQYPGAIKTYQQGLDLGFGQDNRDYWNIRYRLAVSYLEAGEGGKAEPLFREIADEGGPVLQQRVQVKLGMLGLERQLNRLSIRSELGD